MSRGDEVSDGSEPTPTLRRITTFPVKSLDPHERDSARIVENGGLAGDREYALFDGAGNYVNGKRNADVHRLRSAFDPGAGTVTVDAPGRTKRTFSLEGDREALTEWLSAYFGEPVELRRNRAGGFPDDTDASGPTVVSTATIREVASWFPGIDEGGMRRRLRANLEIGGVPAFWEDRLFAGRSERVTFEVGSTSRSNTGEVGSTSRSESEVDESGADESERDGSGVRFEGVNPCQRCVVPSRDPETGEVYEEFTETFVARRRETLPEWSGGEWFDHYYRLMVNTVVPDSERGKSVSVGDEVRIVGPRSADDS
ncbi:MOSC domain-containing protein [Halegenticoccus tardaugens]|uniref:MOSC domain-containing protein n=1 Tax=Halegenticoccus tardaugens TaxID=2071624 RepID=UPI00100A9237|nr:MOSC N-terminal beta barrel domain-containing protein [Halegenticoccus tardaugens]